MTRTRSLASGLLSLSAAAVLVFTAAGGATAAPEDKTKPSVVSASLESTGAADYWTEERMRQAVSGEVLSDKALERGTRSSAETVQKGKEKKVKATQGNVARRASTADPVSHIGKVFFTLSGVNYVCSGNAVSSANESTVATAGHCLSNAPDVRPTKFIFAPGYKDGKAPYGEWEAKSYFVPEQWNTAGDMAYDTGFVVVGPNGGQTLTEAVGGSGLFFNESEGAQYTAFGYPADKPFDGVTLKSCTGTATADSTNPKFGTRGIPCDMNGGSSGGPWFIGTGPDGFQTSVNSYGYKGSKVLYGPTWGAAIEATYNLAQYS